MESVLNFAHTLLKEILTGNDNTLDLTVGNGHDTLFLASISKWVYGFDIQPLALENAKNRLINQHNVTLYLDSHENIDKYPLENIKGIIMNLGYLPTGDKNITTNIHSTLVAIEKSLHVLQVHGRFVIVVYPGHPSGLIESIELDKFIQTLPQKQYQVLKYQFCNQVNQPPYLIAIEKIKEN